MAVDAEAGERQWDEERHPHPQQERLLDPAEGAQPTARVAPAGADGHPQEEQPAPQAPDGGWGWLVAAAIAFIWIATMGPALASPFVFADYLEEIGQGSQGMTTLLSVWMASSSFAGLLCNKLFQRFSCRQVGWIGAAIMGVGQAPVAFATAFWHFILANMCGGLGMGLVVTACFTSFNIYFNRRKTFAMGITQLVIGLGMFGFPMLVQRIVESFSFRIAQCFICAVNMSIVPVLVILRPLKTSDSGNSATQQPSARGNTDCDAVCGGQRTDIPKSFSVDHINERNVEGQSMEGGKFNVSLNHLTKSGRSLNDKEMTCADRKKQFKDASESQQTRSSHHSVGNLNSPLQQTSRPASSVKDTPPPRAAACRNNRRWWSTVVDLFDLKLVQDFSVANILIGISLMFFVDVMYMTVTPLYLFSTGLSRSDAALAMSVMTFSDMGGRLSVAVIGACRVTKNKTLFLLGSAACVLFHTMLIFFEDFTMIMVLVVLMGFSRSYLTSTMPLVVGETCSKERFPAAYGLHTVMSGVLYITIGPLIGLLKDRTNSFMASFITLDILALLCIIPWILEIIVTYKRKKDKLALNT